MLKRVESNGRHLLGLINDVLDFSKIEAGQLKLALADYSMKDVVYKVYSAVEPLAAKKNLGFKLDVPPDMPAGQGDEQKRSDGAAETGCLHDKLSIWQTRSNAWSSERAS